MATSGARKNGHLARALMGAAFALVTAAGLSGMHFSPQWGVVVLSLAAGVGAFLSADLGCVVAVIALSLPMLAANPVIGILWLVVGISSTRYLASDDGRPFLVIGLSFVGAAFGPVWAAAALAGAIMGVTEGAIAAAIAAGVVEVAGIALGHAGVGLVHTGGSVPAALTFAKQPANMFAFTWLVRRLGGLKTQDVNAVTHMFSRLSHPISLLLQPIAWAAGASIAGYTRRSLLPRLGPLRSTLAAVVAGVAALAGATFVALSASGLPVGNGLIALAAGESLVLALVFAAIWEALFPLVPFAAPATVPSTPGSLASEDADVDELLRLIATAEDKLTSQHTSNAVVLITDMKSFSKMTEEDGSVVTAKAIQRHRDLLLPIVETHGGHGKSTGGDGLVAAFKSGTEALRAAAEMQRTLATYNETHPDERDILVRAGLAQGEVILDKSGRPFIGAALNMAARVMNLADGGQIFCTGYVSSSAKEADLETASLGTFELKNISQPIEIFEVLWHPRQTARLPAGN